MRKKVAPRFQRELPDNPLGNPDNPLEIPDNPPEIPDNLLAKSDNPQEIPDNLLAIPQNLPEIPDNPPEKVSNLLELPNTPPATPQNLLTISKNLKEPTRNNALTKARVQTSPSPKNAPTPTTRLPPHIHKDYELVALKQESLHLGEADAYKKSALGV